MRILGLDYGSKTVGVAISDPLGITAQGVETIWRKQENHLRQTDIVMRSSQIYTILQLVKTCKYGSFLYSSMTDRFASSGIKGIPLSPPIRIKIGMIWKKGKYISDNMQKFLNFTRMYYREHPLIQKF